MAGTLIVSGSAAQYMAAVPQIRSSWFDGSRYWVFYPDASGVLKCLYGTALDSLSATNTNGGGTEPTLNNNGRAFACEWGFVSGTPYAWVAQSPTTGDNVQIWRYELTSSGLGTPTKITSNQAGVDIRTMQVMRNYASGDVTRVNYCTSEWATGRSTNRSVTAAMTDTAGFATDSAVNEFFEHAYYIELSDGYLSWKINQGETGTPTTSHCRESVKTLVGDSWGTEQTLEGSEPSGDGDWSDQHYSANESHAGQQDLCQLTSAAIYAAYLDDADTTNGDYGLVVINVRGAAQAGTWSNLTADALGSSTSARMLALGTDGTDIWLFYVKENSGKDTNIYYRKYDVSGASWGSETLLAAAQASHTIQRLVCGGRAENGKLTVVWSEYDTSTYDLLAAEVDTGGLSIPIAAYHYNHHLKV